MDKKNTKCEYMEVKTRLGVEKIGLRNVLYFASNVRVVEAHMIRGEVFRFYEKLDAVQEQLGTEDWLRCHKPFLVNRRWIRQITRESLTIGKEEIPVSRNYYIQLREMGLVGKDKEKLQAGGETGPQEVGVIRFVEGKYAGTQYHIYPNEKLILGRGYNQADLVFDEPQISRVHCWVQYNQIRKGYYISNESANGIYINDKKVEDKDAVIEVGKGDRIRLADTDQIFEIG